MKSTSSKIIFIIGALSAIGTIYLWFAEEANKLFYILMLITLSIWPLNQSFSRRKTKNFDDKIPVQ